MTVPDAGGIFVQGGIYLDFFIVVAVTMDVMFAAMACGTSDIWIPWRSRLCMAAVSSGFLLLSAAGKSVLFDDLPEWHIRLIGFFALTLIGLMQLCGDRLCLAAQRTHCRQLAPLRTLAGVFLDHTRADRDNSKVLSPAEAVVLAIPVSIDSLIGGLGVTTRGLSLLPLFGAALVWNFFAVWYGRWLGARLPIPGERARSMTCGLALMALGVCKLML